MADAAKKVGVLVAPLNPSNLRQVEHEMQQWLVYEDPRATDDHLKDPKHWSNISNYFRPPARLTILAEDGTWMVDALVQASDRNWAKIAILSRHEFNRAKPEEADPEMAVEWAGPQHKWRVVRNDGEVLSKGHVTRDIADEWAKSHRDTLGL